MFVGVSAQEKTFIDPTNVIDEYNCLVDKAPLI